MELPPEEINRDDLLDAIQALDDGESHGFGVSTAYDVLYEGRRYPPKAVVGLAARRLLGRTLEPDEFRGGEGTRCFHILEREGFEIVPKVAPPPMPSGPRADWTDAELRVAVEAYLWMRDQERLGKPYNKAEVNQQLREGPLSVRTKGSVEFRMQNISAVLAAEGEPWISGYKPAANVGVQMAQRLLHHLEALGALDRPAETPTVDPQQLERRTQKLLRRGQIVKPAASDKPRQLQSTTTLYERSPAVRAYVLSRANGHCELCGAPPPFVTADGFPYLEVHHIKPLAEGGADTVENAAALCPNCHRACHYASTKAALASRLFAKSAAY